MRNLVILFIFVQLFFVRYAFSGIETHTIDGVEYVLAEDYDALFKEYESLSASLGSAVDLANFWQDKYEGLFKEYSNLLNDYKTALNNLNSAIELLEDFPQVPKSPSPLIDVNGSIFVGYTNNGFIVDLRLSWTPIHLGGLKIGIVGMVGYSGGFDAGGGGVICF